MNKLLVLTGGTKGIGRAILEKFVRHGFDIVTCARKENELRTLESELIKINSSINVHTVPADVSKGEDVKKFTEVVIGLKRPVDVLVNNAGYFLPGSITDEPDGALEKMMEANLYSAYHIIRGVVDTMKGVKSGHIFNICSIASIKAYPNGGSYAITKFAMLGMTKCLREELKEYGIRVTAVMPGATKTQSWDGVNLPDERFMKTEDVAELIYTSFAISNRSVVEEIIIRPQLGDI